METSIAHQPSKVNSSGADSSGGNCMDLALEGERRCRSGETKDGVKYLEAALTAGTDDLRMLSAIYSQLGNAYFFLGDYAKALEYHRHDLTLARTIGDKSGEAKASGNLGNTLKVIGKFEEAALCCRRHLDISRELGDKVGEGRALYNLGNVYHAQGKQVGRMISNDPSDFPQEVRTALLKAVDCFEKNLEVVQNVSDRMAVGRAYGNLGNTHYLLGNFAEAVDAHKSRLEIAKEFGDKPAMRRAYTNLGNAHVFLGDFDSAVENYRSALNVAIELGDRATEAQACYSLGNTCTLVGQHKLATEYHAKHLSIARLLNDKVGQARACWSLGNAFSSLDEPKKALYFFTVHKNISLEIGDLNGVDVAESNLDDLAQLLGPDSIPDSSGDPSPVGLNEPDIGIHRVRTAQIHASESVPQINNRPDNSCPMRSLYSDAAEAKSADNIQATRDAWDQEAFFDFLIRSQSKRMDNQRCDPRVLLENKENRPRATDGMRDCALDGCSTVSSVSSTGSLASISHWFHRKLTLQQQNRRRGRRPQSSLLLPSASTPLARPDSPTSFVSNLSSIHSPSCGTMAADCTRGESMDGSLDSRRPNRIGTARFRPFSRSYRENPNRASMGSLPKSILKKTVHEGDEWLLSYQRGLTVGNCGEYCTFDKYGRALIRDQNPDAFMDLVAGIQSRRMNDQRASLPYLPGLQNPHQVLGPHIQKAKAAQEGTDDPSTSGLNGPQLNIEDAAVDDLKGPPDDEFFDMLMKCQSSRIEEQRTELRPNLSCPDGSPSPTVVPVPAASTATKGSLTVPDDDFFQIIMKMQQGRINDQRAQLKSTNDTAIGSCFHGRPDGPEIVVCNASTASPRSAANADDRGSSIPGTPSNTPLEGATPSQPSTPSSKQ